MRSKLVGLLFLSGLLVLAFSGCRAKIETIQDKPISVTYKGVIVDVPVNEGSLYDATHFLEINGEKVYLRSLIYDLDDRLYDGALISVSGVPRLVRSQKTLTVDRILILDANREQADSADEDIDKEEDAGLDEDDLDLEEVVENEEKEVPAGRADDYVLPEDFSELTSLPLGFRVAYPTSFYYAQVQNGYAFSDDEVDEDDISSWKIYIQLKDSNFVSLPESWQSIDFELAGRNVKIFYLDVERNVIEQMLSSFDFL